MSQQVVISVYSPKGGAGKTTFCLHLAGALHHVYKKSVCIIDRDAQGSLTVVDNLARKNGNPLPFVVHGNTPSSNPTEDVVILDHAPLISSNHLPVASSDVVVIPVKPSVLDLASYLQARKPLGSFNTLPVLNAFKSNVGEHVSIRNSLNHNGSPWPVIGERSIIQSAFNSGKTIHDLSRWRAGQARGEFELLLKEIEKAIQIKIPGYKF